MNFRTLSFLRLKCHFHNSLAPPFLKKRYFNYMDKTL